MFGHLPGRARYVVRHVEEMTEIGHEHRMATLPVRPFVTAHLQSSGNI
jgi:hypothetical protein